MALLEIANLYAATDGKPILRGVTMDINAGQSVALMGLNGSGKSTLAQVLMGHPEYVVTGGPVLYDGQDLLALKPTERAVKGLFLSFQYPQTIAGVTIGNFLRLAYNSTRLKPISVASFLTLLKSRMDMLGIPHNWIGRAVNVGFSGGERKRLEMLQLAVLQPKLAILDETDSGLDIDALRSIASFLRQMRSEHPTMALLIITHYQRLLEYVPVDKVCVMQAGTIVASGGAEMARAIEAEGYGSFVEKV